LDVLDSCNRLPPDGLLQHGIETVIEMHCCSGPEVGTVSASALVCWRWPSSVAGQ
jgi:hypothetical protein